MCNKDNSILEIILMIILQDGRSGFAGETKSTGDPSYLSILRNFIHNIYIIRKRLTQTKAEKPRSWRPQVADSTAPAQVLRPYLEPWKLMVCSAVWVQRQEKVGAPALESQTVRENSLLLFCSIQTSNRLMGSMHIAEGHLLYSVHQFKCSSPAKTPSQTQQNSVWPNIWAPRGPVNVTHKIHHHRTSQVI